MPTHVQGVTICRALALVALAFLAQACVTSPYNGQLVTDPSAPVTIAGFYNRPNVTLTIEAANPSTGVWEVLGTTTSEATPAFAAGTWKNSPPLYAYSTTVQVSDPATPQTFQRWVGDYRDRAATLRVRSEDFNLFTGHANGAFCVFQNASQAEDFYTTTSNCGYQQTPVWIRYDAGGIIARTPETVSVHLDRLHWDSVIITGGGPPTESPYLWTIFFKADGSTLQLTDAGTISGSATIVVTPGSHGNLGTRSLQVGQSIIIPDGIGQWDSTLQPIPVPPSLQLRLGQDNLPAFFGAVAVLMLEGHVSDHGAEAGHAALNAAVQSAIDAILRRIGQDHPMVTQQDIDSVTTGIDQQVSKAIQDAQNIFENLWSWSKPDVSVGQKVWVWNQDQHTATTGEVQIAEQFWGNSGLWGIDGTVRVHSGSLRHAAQNAPNGSFGGWRTMGDARGLGHMAVGRNADGRLEVFAVDTAAGLVWHTAQTTPNGAFGGWSRLFDAVGVGQIAVGRNADGRLEVFAVDTAAGLVWHTAQTTPNGAFGGWSRLFDAVGVGQITVASNADGRLEVFAVDTAAGLVWHTAQTTPNGAFGGWSRLFDAVGVGQITVASNADGRLEVFAVDTAAGLVWHTAQTTPNGAFGGWSRLFDAVGVGQITVASNADGRLEVFAVDTAAGLVWHTAQTTPNGAFGGWSRLFDAVGVGQITVGRNTDGRLEVFALDATEGSAWHTAQTTPNGSFGGWQIMGDARGFSRIVVTRNADGRLDVFSVLR